jgi:hypothetical protein
VDVLGSLESGGIYSLRLVPSLKQSREERCYYRGDKGHDRGGNIGERSENYENYENQGRAIGTKMKADSNIAWSENGELKYKTETVRGSNVVDLVNDVPQPPF